MQHVRPNFTNNKASFTPAPGQEPNPEPELPFERLSAIVEVVLTAANSPSDLEMLRRFCRAPPEVREALVSLID